MRKLKLQVQISVDGYIARHNGAMDWMVWDWDNELKKYVSEITEPVDCIVMGRKLAQGFIPYWATVSADPEDPQFTFGLKMSNTKKIVFTKTLGKSHPSAVGWSNTDLAKGDLIDEIKNLKNQNGKDIMVYGGGTFVSALIRAGLIDEFHLFINPTALGDGMTIFKGLDKSQKLRLIESKSYVCGITMLNYKLK